MARPFATDPDYPSGREERLRTGRQAAIRPFQDRIAEIILPGVVAEGYDTTPKEGDLEMQKDEGITPTVRFSTGCVAATLAQISGYRLDVLKLQKLAWLAEIEHRLALGRPLLDDDFVATDFGPMPLLLADFQNGVRPVPAWRFRRYQVLRAEHPLEAESQALLVRLVRYAQKATPGQLVAATHREAWSARYVAGARVRIDEATIDHEVGQRIAERPSHTADVDLATTP